MHTTHFPDYRALGMEIGSFKGHPSIIARGVEGLLELLADTSWKSLPYPGGYRVKSEWLISLIDEIEASGQYPYNSTVINLAVDRLSIDGLSRADCGTPLSQLVYNAQCFRHSDKLEADGFSPLTQEMAETAYARKQRIELIGGKVISPRLVDGKVYVFEPRKRRYAVSTTAGTPARLQENA